MSISFKTKPHLMQKIEKALNDTLYKNAIKTSSNYNNRLIAERASRLPFIDLQTGVAQNNCSLWMNRWERMPGYNQGQLYSYPSRRWRKTRGSYLFNSLYSNKINLEQRNGEEKSESIGSSSSSSDMNANCTVDCTVKIENVVTFTDKSHEMSRDGFSFDSDELILEIPDSGEPDDLDTEEDEDFSCGTKRRTRKKYAKRKKACEYTDAEKPYVCDLCGIKYKTRPGLSYHYAHSHASVNDGALVGLTNPLNGDNGQMNQHPSLRNSVDMGEMNTRSVFIIPSHSYPSLSNQSPSSYPGHLIDNPLGRESFLREKIIISPSSLSDQRSLTIDCPTNQQFGLTVSSKYSNHSDKSSTSTLNHDPDDLSNLSSNCRNILWPLYDPLFSPA